MWKEEELTLSEVVAKNYQYIIKYDYEDARSNCNCDEDDYCRCSTIENARIESIDFDLILKEFNKVFHGDEFVEYCINRILTACKLYDKNYWSLEICGGYYGEEIGGIFIEDQDTLLEWLEKLQNANTDKERLLVVLEFEYGYILEELKSFDNWDIIVVDKCDIIIGQQEHYKKLDKKVVESYKGFSLPRGVCIAKDDKFRLIDGYHRMCANEDDSVKIIVGK